MTAPKNATNARIRKIYSCICGVIGFIMLRWFYEKDKKKSTDIAFFYYLCAMKGWFSNHLADASKLVLTGVVITGAMGEKGSYDRAIILGAALSAIMFAIATVLEILDRNDKNKK